MMKSHHNPKLNLLLVPKQQLISYLVLLNAHLNLISQITSNSNFNVLATAKHSSCSMVVFKNTDNKICTPWHSFIKFNSLFTQSHQNFSQVFRRVYEFITQILEHASRYHRLEKILVSNHNAVNTYIFGGLSGCNGA